MTTQAQSPQSAVPTARLSLFMVGGRSLAQGITRWVRRDGPSFLRQIWREQRQWLLLGILLAIILIWPTIWFWQIWTVPESPLSYQPFVPLGALWLALSERQSVSEQYRELVMLFPADSPKRRGKLWPVVSGCALMVLAYLATVPPLSMIALLLMIAGTIYYIYGPYILSALRRPLGFLLAMAPIPNVLVSNSTSWLQVGCATAAGQLLQLINPQARVVGTFIELPNYKMEVAGPCSGVSVLFPVLAMTLWLTLFKRMRLFPSLILMIIGAAISLLMNVLRIVAMGLIGTINAPLAQQLHDTNSAIFTVLAFYFTFQCAGLLLRPWRLPWNRKKGMDEYGYGYYGPLEDPAEGSKSGGKGKGAENQ